MNKFERIARDFFIILAIICLCTSFTYAQFSFSPYTNTTSNSYYYPSTSYQATPSFYTSFSPQTSYASTTTPYSALSASYYTPNTTSYIQAAPQNSFYFPNTSLYGSNSSFYQPPTTSATTLASAYTPLASSYSLASSFYQLPTTTPVANITGSYAPIATTNASTGFYLPSISTTPVYSPQAINYYSPPTVPTVSAPPVPVAASVALPNTYIPNATYYPAAGIVIDIEGDYVGEWESTLMNEDGDIKKCEIDQDGIFIDGSMKLKEFTISGEPEFTGEINGNSIIMDVELTDGIGAVFVGEIFVAPDGEIEIAGTYTVMSLYNGAMIDQGIFELEED